MVAKINGINKINALRSRHVDTPAITLNSTLDRLAQSHCDDLAKMTVTGEPKIFRSNFTGNVFYGETTFANKTTAFDEQGNSKLDEPSRSDFF